MDFEINENDEFVFVSVIGDINLYTSKDFKNRLFEISQASDKNISIDFSHVDHMDSSGIGVLISLYKIQTKRGKRLAISKANEDILTFIRLSNLTELIDG